MRKQKIIGIAGSALVVLVAVALTVQMLFPEKTFDLSRFSLSVIGGIPSPTGLLSLSGDEYYPVAENTTYCLEINPEKNVFHVINKTNGKVWESGFPEEDYAEATPRNKRIMHSLCAMTYTDFDNESGTIYSSTDGVETVYQGLKNGVEIQMNFPEQGIAFSLQIQLNEEGFRACVPAKSLKESADYGVLQISILPSFGALLSGTDGYLLYPDGCGALYDCLEKTGYEEIYTADVYGSQILDMDLMQEQVATGQKSISVPYFGSASGGSGFIAYVEEGATNANMSFAPASSFFLLNRIYPSIVYRRTAPRTTPAGEEIYTTEKEKRNADFSVQYLLLAEDGADYVGMAAALRGYLQKIGRLPSHMLTGSTVSLALEILMGTQERSLYGSSGLAMTSYLQAQKMLESLTSAGVEDIRAILLGWQKEGYGVTPASTDTASYLGSTGSFRALMESSDPLKNVRIYLQTDYVNAYQGRFNQRSEVVRNFFNVPITDSTEKHFLTNPYLRFSRFESREVLSFQKTGATGVAFDAIASLLPYDNSEGRKLSAADAAGIYSAMLGLTQQYRMEAAVQGGSDYTFSHADYIYNLSDDDSNLFTFTRRIYFLQMLLHGVIPYSCAMPGNMSSDPVRQKLEWVESGSMPYFLVSETASNDLRDTDIEDIFSSKFSDWQEWIVSTWQEMNQRLSPVVAATVTSHTYVQAEVVVVGYSSGYSVIVNYSDKAVTWNGIVIPAVDYVVAKV